MATVLDVRTREGRIDALLWAATALCAVLTLLLSLATVPPGTTAFPNADKVAHFVAYLVTAALLFLAAVWRPVRGDGAFAGWGWWLPIAVVAVGGVIELIQAQIGREAEVADWLVEVAAVAIAYGAIVAWRRRSEVP